MATDGVWNTMEMMQKRQTVVDLGDVNRQKFLGRGSRDLGRKQCECQILARAGLFSNPGSVPQTVAVASR